MGKPMYTLQAFIQALLSTAVLPQRFRFFTVCLVYWLHDRHQRNKFRNLGLQIAGKCIFLGILRVLQGVLKRSLLERFIELFFMSVYKYLN